MTGAGLGGVHAARATRMARTAWRRNRGSFSRRCARSTPLRARSRRAVCVRRNGAAYRGVHVVGAYRAQPQAGRDLLG